MNHPLAEALCGVAAPSDVILLPSPSAYMHQDITSSGFFLRMQQAGRGAGVPHQAVDRCRGGSSPDAP